MVASSAPTVATNAALATTPVAFAPAVIRLDYSQGLGAPAMVFTSSITPCFVNAGAGDGASQVPAVGGGCWNGNLPSSVDVREFGATCNGTGSDSVAIQNAINWLQYTGGGNRGSGTLLIPATGGACEITTGLTNSSGQVAIEGIGGLYWPGPYDNNEADWTQKGSWFHCSDTVNPCITLSAGGSRVSRLNFWYTQPTPVHGVFCGNPCTFTHDWTPTIYPYTITINGAQNFNYLEHITIVNASHCIDIEGTSGNVNTIYTAMDHMYLGCFVNGTRFHLVDNDVNLNAIQYQLWWYPEDSGVLGYVEGDTGSAGHKIDWDMEYAADIHANGITFTQSYAAIYAKNATISSGIGSVTLAAQSVQLSDATFLQVCQAVILDNTGPGGAAVFEAAMSNVVLNQDFQTSNATQCAGGYTPVAFNLTSDKAMVTIANLDVLTAQTVASIGGGASGRLSISNLRCSSYSTWVAAGSAFIQGAGAALEIPSGLEQCFVGGSTGGPHVSGAGSASITSSNTITVPLSFGVESPAGVARQYGFLTAQSSGATNGGVSYSRWGLVADSSAESGGNAGSNLCAYRYSDTGGFLDTPWCVARASGTTTFNDQLRTAFGTPTIAGGACGTGANGAVSGTNQAGQITIGAVATTTCAISFSATLSNAPNACILFPQNAAAAATGTTVARVGTPTTGGFTITGAALAGANYNFLCI